MRTSIIVPVHNNPEFTLACIESIRENTQDYEIIIVDNGSSPPFVAPYEELKAIHGVKVIRNEENVGYSAAANQGIKTVEGGVLAFLNNDILTTPGWLDYLTWHIDNGFDLVGPCSNSVAGPQQVKVGYRFEDRILNSVDKKDLNGFASHFHSANYRDSKPHYLLVLYCLVMRREVIDRVGLFDEAFTLGNFEDDDFCLRAIEAGFRLGIAQDVFIHHFGGVTLKSMDIDIKALFAKNWGIFKSKWSTEKYEELKRKAVA
ncbi:MAG: glycosyltransferase family 2 protein [Desulfobacterales bacterium]|nr:glycosyltransferase family 2 protein [Desulfobacterales bacterium]